jgi:hypothetical protein
MVNLDLRKMPGGHVPQKFRLYFQRTPAESGLEHYVVGDTTTLKKFLVDRLNMAETAATRLSIEVESTASASTKLATYDESEVKGLLHDIEAEARLTEQSRGKTIQVQ